MSPFGVPMITDARDGGPCLPAISGFTMSTTFLKISPESISSERKYSPLLYSSPTLSIPALH